MITIQEAIDYLRDPICVGLSTKEKLELHEEAINMAVKALEKQIPQKTGVPEKVNSSEIPNCSDLISRQAEIEAWKNDFKGYINALDMPKDDYNGIMEYIDELPSAQPKKRTEERTETRACDLISRQAAIDALMEKDKKLRNINWYDKPYAEAKCIGIDEALSIISNLPCEEPEWSNHTVACLLAELFDDTCACNYNDIDEWLPKKCELLDSCPNPVGVACWEQFLKHKAERKTDYCGAKMEGDVNDDPE